MGNARHRPLLHVAFHAVVGRRHALGILWLERAAFDRMAGKARGAIRSFFLAGFGTVMDGVAGKTGKLPMAGLVTLAQLQRRVVPAYREWADWTPDGWPPRAAPV